MMMEMCSLRRIILFLTILHCLQGIYAECEISDASLKIEPMHTKKNAYYIGCRNSSLVMTVGKVKTFRMHMRNNEIFKCDDQTQTFTTTIMGQRFSITEAKCISRVTCDRPTENGVDITDTEKQLKYVGEKGDEGFTGFADYTAGDWIALKCANGYGQPKSSCDEDPNAYDYDLDETKEKLPTEGTFTCKGDGKWNSEPVIDCKKIVCKWTGNLEIDNGTLVGLKKEYLLDDTVRAVCDAGFKPTDIAVCQANGCISKPTVSCKEIHCPRLDYYNSFENGNIHYSNQPITADSKATFNCDPGYEIFGPDVRTCQGDGTWSDDVCVTCQRLEYANEPPTIKTSCPAPCVPYGAIKEGSSYEIGDTVLFRCHENFHYLGAVDTIARVCLANAMWNGTDIRCTGTKQIAGKLLGETLEKVVKRAEHNRKEWENRTSDQASSRTINIYKSLQLYLLVDTSGSITNETFEIMKQFLTILLGKVFGAKNGTNDTEVFLRFFGKTVSKEFQFMSLSQFQNHNITRDEAKNMTEGDTNIPVALQKVINDVSTRRVVNDQNTYTPSRALIVISDGQNNMGGDPSDDTINTLHDLVETYAIFVGKQEGERLPIDQRGFQLMKKLASKKTNTQDEHFISITFNNSIEGLKGIIEQMTNETADRIQCGEFSELTNLNKDFDTVANAQEGAWPWMVDLENGDKTHQCGATILNENWILTAAHCNIQPDWKIYIGRTSKPGQGRSFTENSMGSINIIHEKFTNKTYEYDLRVVKLANPIIFKRERPFAAPVCLFNATKFPELKYDDLFKPNSSGVVTGWAFDSDNLKQLQMRINNTNVCQENAANQYRFRFDANVNFCAMGIGKDSEYIDASQGYSGGPFVVKYEGKGRKPPVFIQIGIVSWGFDNIKGKPGYYVRLNQELIDWINKAISK